MESLLNYCTSGETFESINYDDEDNSTEKKFKTLPASDCFVSTTSRNDTAVAELTQMNLRLQKQVEDSHAMLEHKKSQLTSYQQLIETLEEDYNRVYKSLTTATKYIQQCESKINNYEATIDSMKNELDSFYHLEKRQNLSISGEKLSFSDEINTSNHSIQPSKAMDTEKVIEGVQLHEPIIDNQLTMFNSFQQVCNENMSLKRENETLFEEVRLLRKDNEDYERLLWRGPADFSRPMKAATFMAGCCDGSVDDGGKSSKNFVNSTPIKKDSFSQSGLAPMATRNFISYKDLDLSLNEYSMDEDDEQLEQQQLEIRTPVSTAAPIRKSLGLLTTSSSKFVDIRLNTGKSTLYRLPLDDCSQLVNESMPSVLVDDSLMMTNLAVTPGAGVGKSMASDFGQLSNGEQLLSIEEEIMPVIDISTSTNHTQSNSSVISINASKISSTTSKEEDNTQIEVKKLNEVTTSTNYKESQEVKIYSEAIEPNHKMFDNDSSNSHLLQCLWSTIFYFVAFLLTLEYRKFEKLFQTLITSLLLITLASILTWSVRHTRLLPYYSFEEIFFDLLTQYRYYH